MKSKLLLGLVGVCLSAGFYGCTKGCSNKNANDDATTSHSGDQSSHPNGMQLPDSSFPDDVLDPDQNQLTVKMSWPKGKKFRFTQTLTSITDAAVNNESLGPKRANVITMETDNQLIASKGGKNTHKIEFIKYDRSEGELSNQSPFNFDFSSMIAGLSLTYETDSNNNIQKVQGVDKIKSDIKARVSKTAPQMAEALAAVFDEKAVISGLKQSFSGNIYGKTLSVGEEWSDDRDLKTTRIKTKSKFEGWVTHDGVKLAKITYSGDIHYLPAPLKKGAGDSADQQIRPVPFHGVMYIDPSTGIAAEAYSVSELKTVKAIEKHSHGDEGHDDKSEENANQIFTTTTISHQVTKVAVNQSP